MSGDEFGHLEHADLALAVEDRPERIVRVNHRSLFLILTSVLLDVVPEFFGELGTRKRFGTNDRGEFIIRLDRAHEGGVRFTLGSFFGCGFRHRG